LLAIHCSQTRFNQDALPRPPESLDVLRRGKGGAEHRHPKIALTDLSFMTRRVFRKSGYRFFDRNTRHFISDAFSNGEPVSTSPENAMDPLSFD
jgi:hypothetical protein